MNTNPFEDTTRWLDGSDMPQEAIDHITKKIRLAYYSWATVILLFTAVVFGVVFKNLIGDFKTESVYIGVVGGLVFAMVGFHFLHGGIKRVRILKRRRFFWFEGVTGGLYIPHGKGNGYVGVFVKSDSSSVMIKNYTLSGFSLGYKKEGIPVYSVMFNSYGREFFRGGFLGDPMVFKKNR